MTKHFFSIIVSFTIPLFIYNLSNAETHQNDSFRAERIINSTQRSFDSVYDGMVFTTKNYHIVNGDTIETNDQKFPAIKLWGIQAPEYFQTCESKKSKKTVYCGKNSTKALINFTKGKSLICTTNSVDKLHRILVECKNYYDQNLNSLMVVSGNAIAESHITQEFINEQTTAQKSHIGIWGTNFIQPDIYREHIKQLHKDIAVYLHHMKIKRIETESKHNSKPVFSEPEIDSIFDSMGDNDDSSNTMTDENFQDHFHD